MSTSSETKPEVTKVVVATSVMLSFISFWRAAAIVLNDLGSSAYYVGGIAEQAVGRAAPWFILGVMLFSYAVRAIYIESCAMFTRGGVYRVVKEAMGGTLAKLSVSALMFDYILTGPISGVSAGQYIVGLVAQTMTYFGHRWEPSKGTINLWAAGIAMLVIIYFWWRNTRGIHESSDDALRIMYVTTIMVVFLIIWSGTSIFLKPRAQRLPPKPIPQNLSFNRDAVGWLPDIAPHALHPLSGEAAPAAYLESAPAEPRYGLSAGALLGLIGILIAFGHSFLAMSGEESLAQVNRELEYPKHRNLMRAGLVIFVYSLLFTSLVSFFAYALIPDNIRPRYFDNLISGIAMNLVGPLPLKLLFQAFIVVVGFLMLAGAVNTAIIGSNGVLNRVSEDGVLPDWLRKPHRRYGTTHRMINLIVLLQLVTIIGSRGNVYVLGEAYAFGVIWSFAFKGLAVLLLRFKDRSPREWKVPLNLPLNSSEVPLGLGIIAALLFSVAGINLITKQVATISGIAFTLVFFLIFTVSERVNEKRRGDAAHVEVDQFRVQLQQVVSHQSVAVRPGNTLCLVRDYNTLDHLRKALELTHTGETDLVVMTVHLLRGPDTGYRDFSDRQVFTDYEQLLFSRVVALAEKAGKHVDLLVVPSSDVFQAIAQTAAQLHSSMIITGHSAVMTLEEQARRLGQAWERLPQKPKHQVCFRVIKPNGRMRDFYLGAHAPQMSEREINQIHELWLEMTSEPGWEHLHHKDIVTIALALLKEDRKSGEHAALLEKLRRELLKQQTPESAVQEKDYQKGGKRPHIFAGPGGTEI
jgi:amino acid transporter